MILGASKKVFKNYSYAILAALAAFLTFSLAVWLPNLELAGRVIADNEHISFFGKLSIISSFYGSIFTNFTSFSAVYVVLISILFGFNLAMVVYYFKNRAVKIFRNGAGTSFLGIMSGLLGVGCAACGSVILSAALSALGVSGLLAFLPFGGGEFGILGVILLSLSVYMVGKEITNPAVCKVQD